MLPVDLNPAFVARVRAAALARGLDQRLFARVGDMADPPALDGERGRFDLLWAESSIYNLGHERALACWRELLQPAGWLVFSDIVWARGPGGRPAEAVGFWAEEYPELSDAEAVSASLARAGFDAVVVRRAGRAAWAGYYEPLRQRLERLSAAPAEPVLAKLLRGLEHELEIHDRYGEAVELAFFGARKPA